MPRNLKRCVQSTILGFCLVVPLAGHAMANCAARDAIITKLEGGYGEEFAGGGLRGSNAIYEVWLSEERGTWTILMTRPDGTSCIMASGTNWRDALPAVKKPAGIPG